MIKKIIADQSPIQNFQSYNPTKVRLESSLEQQQKFQKFFQNSAKKILDKTTTTKKSTLNFEDKLNKTPLKNSQILQKTTALKFKKPICSKINFQQNSPNSPVKPIASHRNKLTLPFSKTTTDKNETNWEKLLDLNKSWRSFENLLQSVALPDGLEIIENKLSSNEFLLRNRMFHDKKLLSIQKIKKSQQPTFTPKIIGQSKRIQVKESEATQITNKMYSYQNTIKDKLENTREHILKQREEKEKDELEKNCTFKPKINHFEITRKLPANLIDRNALWLQNKQEKIAVKKFKNSKLEIAECTFKPVVN